MRASPAAIAVLAILLLSNAPAVAEVQVQGRGEVQYETGLFSSKPSPEVRQKAIDEAKKAAVSRYASNFAPAKYALFQKVAQNVLSRVNQFVIDAIVLDEGTDANSKVYYVVVRASIDDAKLDAVLNEQGQAAADAAVSAGAKPATISFLFVARETESVKEFDARQTQMSTSQSATSAQQQQGLAGGSARYEQSTSTTSANTTGGSTLRKANETTYRVTSPEDMNAAMNDVFASKGFEVYDYRDVVSQCGGADVGKIYAEFAKADELSRDTRNSAFAAARQCEIHAFALGTMDVGLQDTDPVTGNKRVYVSVRSQLLDVTGKLPRILASVGPVQYAGLGPDPSVATRNALQLAATEVAKSIADQLNAKGAR